MSRDKFGLSYDFFVKMEKQEQEFTLMDICKATDWKQSTPETYISKKWGKFLTKSGVNFRVKGILTYEREAYIRLMSQKNDVSSNPKKPEISPEIENLVLKAREAAIHALDSYNRPRTVFRTEGFVVMMVIAWRSLFHAIFSKRDIDFTYRNKIDNTPLLTDGDKRAWELQNCVDEFYKGSSNPIRTNLEFIIGLRNKIEHRFVPAIDPKVAGECQALLLNFEELLIAEFSEYYALHETLAVPLQITSFRSESQLEAIKQFQTNNYNDVIQYIDKFRDGISNSIYEDLRYSFRVYLIPKIGNHERSSDISLEFIHYDKDNPADMELLKQQVALIREKQIPVANAGMYKPSQVAEAVAKKTGRKFTTQDHTRAWQIYDVRKKGITPIGCNTKYCQFDEVHKDYVYTQDWISFLSMKMSDYAEYEKLLAFKLNS